MALAAIVSKKSDTVSTNSPIHPRSYTILGLFGNCGVYMRGWHMSNKCFLMRLSGNGQEHTSTSGYKTKGGLSL